MRERGGGLGGRGKGSKGRAREGWREGYMKKKKSENKRTLSRLAPPWADEQRMN